MFSFQDCSRAHPVGGHRGDQHGRLPRRQRLLHCARPGVGVCSAVQAAEGRSAGQGMTFSYDVHKLIQVLPASQTFFNLLHLEHSFYCGRHICPRPLGVLATGAPGRGCILPRGARPAWRHRAREGRRVKGG